MARYTLTDRLKPGSGPPPAIPEQHTLQVRCRTEHNGARNDMLSACLRCELPDEAGLLLGDLCFLTDTKALWHSYSRSLSSLATDEDLATVRSDPPSVRLNRARWRVALPRGEGDSLGGTSEGTPWTFKQHAGFCVKELAIRGGPHLPIKLRWCIVEGLGVVEFELENVAGDRVTRILLSQEGPGP